MCMCLIIGFVLISDKTASFLTARTISVLLCIVSPVPGSIVGAQQIFMERINECSLEEMRSLIGHGRRDGERVSGQENSVCTGLGKTRERQGAQ